MTPQSSAGGELQLAKEERLESMPFELNAAMAAKIGVPEALSSVDAIVATMASLFVATRTSASVASMMSTIESYYLVKVQEIEASTTVEMVNAIDCDFESVLETL